MRHIFFTKLKYIILLTILELVYDVGTLCAQKVGLVLSGGGALGSAHVGAIKALEDNGIPIDCITGTSAGALIGSFYAAGYSPEEMMQLSLKETDRWLGPGMVYKEEYYFNKLEIDGTFVQIPLSFRGIKRSLPENLISDFELNLGLNQYLARAGWGRSFDSLFVPYRCFASDIFEKKAIPISDGSLPFAVRASTAVPLFFSAASNDRFQQLYDGGVYDNFPVLPMLEIFNPDIVIGINVAGGPSTKEEIQESGKYIRSLLAQGLIDQKTWENMPPNGILLMPDLDNMSAMDFSAANQLEAFERGYRCAMACIDDIKAAIARSVPKEVLQEKRKAFRAALPPIQIEELNVFGVRPVEQFFVKELFSPMRRRPLTYKDFEKGYYRLKSDGNYLSVFPELIYNPEKANYQARLFVKPTPRFNLKFGGSFFTPTDHQIQLMAKHQGVLYFGYQVEADLMRGSFSNHARLRGRVDFPTRKPFFLEIENSIVQKDLQRMSFSLFNRDKSADVSYQGFEFRSSLNFPLTHRSRISVGYAYQDISDKYYNPDVPVTRDSLDNTNFVGRSLSMRIQRNTLDKKMYATKGARLCASLHLNEGTEYFIPGSTQREKLQKDHVWAQAHFTYQNYISPFKDFAVGFSFDAAISALPPYSNITATLLSSPKFQPLSDSPMLFLPNLYSKAFAAPGIQFIYSITSKIDFRLEGYYMQRFQEFVLDLKGEINQKYNFDFQNNVLCGSGGFVYETTIGPIGAFINYYKGQTSSDFRPFVHIGYLIFRQHPWN